MSDSREFAKTLGDATYALTREEALNRAAKLIADHDAALIKECVAAAVLAEAGWWAYYWNTMAPTGIRDERLAALRAFGADPLARIREEATKPLATLLYGLNPFEGGRDGDQCIWCHREYDRNIESWQQGQMAEFHDADCEFIAALAALPLDAPSSSQPKEALGETK